MLRRMFEWLTLSDYDAEKDEATRRVIKRYARNNAAFQNGCYLDEDDLIELSKRADQAMSSLARMIPPPAS